MNKKWLFTSSVIILMSCAKDVSDEHKSEETLAVSEASFSKEDGALSFHSKDVFKNFMETYQDKEDEIVDFYADGFVPYRPLDNLEEETFSKLVQAKQLIIQNEKGIPLSAFKKNAIDESDEDYDEEDDEFIRNDKFASLLNAKGEIIIGDSIYRYTPYGRFSSHISKKEKLEDYIKALTPDYQIVEGTTFVTEDIQRFIPFRDEFKKYEIVNMENTHNLSEIKEEDGSKRLPTSARFNLPEYTRHYNSCHNSRSSWVDRLFGVSYDCEYHFNRKRKLRTTFAVENYGVYMEIYAQAKFKQKTWFGWFSSRDAKHTYLKINHASLTFDEREVTINSKDVKTGLDNIKKYGQQLGEWMRPKRNTQAVVNTITTPQSQKSFSSMMSDFGNYVRQGVNIAKEVINDAELSIDFGNFFDQKTHNVVVLSIIDKEFTRTNKQIMEDAFKVLKSKGELMRDKPTGIFLMEHNSQTGKVTSRSYTIYDQVHYSSGLAIVRNYFKIPKKFTLKNLNFSYTNNLQGSKETSSSASFTYPNVRKIDLSIETGAFYDGRWAGSKLTVQYNN